MTSLATVTVQLIPVDLIDASPLNPRKAFPEEKLRALADSLLVRGQLEAGIVRPHPTAEGRYELANGERRWRACQLAGIKVFATKVQVLSDAEMVELALAVGMGSNVESLTAVEEAAGYEKLMKLREWSERQLADHLGRSNTHVMQRLALLNLRGKARAALESGRLSARTAYYIASIPGEAAREEAAAAILNSELHGGVMPEGAALTYIRDHVCRTLRATPFDQKDPALLPEVGACATCRFRAGNNPEEYGAVFDPKKGGGADRCMHPGCFDQKVEAHRERLLAKHAVGGKVALSKEENSRVFPREEPGLDYASEFVDYGTKPTPDLLKKEVTTVPTWRELTQAAELTVYLAVDQGGRVVELVKRDEAIAAADLAERKIFNDAQVKRGTASKGPKAEAGAQSASRAAEEKEQKAAQEKAERARRKKEKSAREWLLLLRGKIAAREEGRRPWWASYVSWALLYDLVAAQLTDEETAFVVGAFDPESAEDRRDRAALDVYAGALDGDGLAALVICLQLAPRVRAEGAEGELATEWHKAILLGEREETRVEEPALEDAPAAVAEAAGLPEAERKQLTEIATAHAGGMSAVKIARHFRRSLADVCGMLELDEAAVRAERDQLDEELGDALAAAGVKPGAVKAVLQGMLGRKDLNRADYAPEELRHLIERLSLQAKAAQPEGPGAQFTMPGGVDEVNLDPAAVHEGFADGAEEAETFDSWFFAVFVVDDAQAEGGQRLATDAARDEQVGLMLEEESADALRLFARWLTTGPREATPGCAWLAARVVSHLAQAKKAA